MSMLYHYFSIDCHVGAVCCSPASLQPSCYLQSPIDVQVMISPVHFLSLGDVAVNLVVLTFAHCLVHSLGNRWLVFFTNNYFQSFYVNGFIRVSLSHTGYLLSFFTEKHLYCSVMDIMQTVENSVTMYSRVISVKCKNFA